MNEEVLSVIEKAIEKSIKVNVNGKIDHLTEMMGIHNAKHEEDMIEVREHIKEVRPYLDSARGVKTLGEIGKWIAGVGGSFIIIWAWVNGKI